LATEQHDDGVRLCGDETKDENILGSTVVTFQDCVAERRLGVQLHFFMASADQVVDDMGGRGITTGAAEPLVAAKALDYGAWVVDTAISAHNRVSENSNAVRWDTYAQA
jgi:hypothetical protein